MKKIYTFLLMASMLMAFTACEDRDADEARTLDGTWTGYIDTYYMDRYGLAGNSYRTTMFFYQRDRYGGTGYEVDYDLNNRYTDYYYCEFDWEVYNGEIIIRYADSWNDVYIYDYHLTSNTFVGYMDDGSSRDIRFELYYDGNFDWGYWTWTRGNFTRAANGKRYHASGTFANIKKEASN